MVLRIPLLRFAYVYGTLTLFGGPSQILPLRLHFASGVLQPRRTRPSVWAVPLSLATTRRIFSFPRATEMFQFARFPSLRMTEFPQPGFPIRIPPALSAAHALPELFAVYHVLHRHLTPRHPPYALIRFSPHPCGDTENQILSCISTRCSRFLSSVCGC